MSHSQFLANFLTTLAVLVTGTGVLQATLPSDDTGVATKAVRTPGFEPPPSLQLADDVAPLASLGVQDGQAFIDARTGKWASVVLKQELLPGAGNDLTWQGLGIDPPQRTDEIATAARRAFRNFLGANEVALGVRVDELAPNPKVTVHGNGRLIQIYARRASGDIPVRDAEVTAVINSGNLVLLGVHNWGDPPATSQLTVSAALAHSALLAHLNPFTPSGFRRAERLEFVPIARDGGLTYRLAWILTPHFTDHLGNFEAVVDAEDANGGVLAFFDTNHYGLRDIIGAVLPVSNDNVEPDGVEVRDFPMPFADLTDLTGNTVITDSGGNAPVCMEGEIFTTFNGPYVDIDDLCDLAPVVPTTEDTLDLGIAGYPTADPHPGTNCALVTEPGTSAVPGNTRSSRTGFYEVNRLMETARAQLPENQWLRSPLTTRMNIPAACNAFWGLNSINFFIDSGACRNTGEIAAVFDHEWGHGMDANDAHPGVSAPGEGIADIFSNVRLAESCVGRGFSRSIAGLDANCGGNGDPCLDCTGVREVDFLLHLSQQPHDVAWADDACGSGSSMPCGGGTHCEGHLVSESSWDLMTRDLRCQGDGWEVGGTEDVQGGQCTGGAPASRDFSTALELTTKLAFLGGGLADNWFQCTKDGTGGCNADSGYLNYIAADDDNGDLNDGTPHMSAIFSAFDRHGIACPNIPVQDSGCAGTPNVAPNVTATPLDKAVKLSWGPVAGASRYEIFRTEGIHGCDFGKIKVGETTDTEIIVTGLRNGFETFFTVAAAGLGATCLGPMSSCTAATAQPGAGAVMAIDEASRTSSIVSGDGDIFLDNCESAQLRVTVGNLGSTDLNNLRVVGVSSPSHPGSQTAQELPVVVADSVPVCGQAEAAIEVIPSGLVNNDVFTVDVELTTDELEAQGISHTTRFTLDTTEGDFGPVTSQTFDFEAGKGMWRNLYGTFDLATEGGGADGTATYLASSSFLNSSCDGSSTPLVRLTPDSTFELSTNFSIEASTAGGAAAWDRANVKLRDFATGDHTVVEPGGGRAYNVLPGSAGDFSGFCTDLVLEPGWGEEMATWEASTFSAADLGAAGIAGQPVQLLVQYGTDAAAVERGFWFDQVVLTNAEFEIPDSQDDVCQPDGTCDEIDDDDPAVEYRRGWHRRSHPDATGGGYHRRLGSNSNASTARVEFTGDSVTYLFATSDIGGTAGIFIDGALVETLSYDAGGGSKQENPTFGHTRTYDGLGDGPHELLIEHVSGAVYVDGFEFSCEGDGGPDPAGAEFHSETELHTASAGEGLLIERSVDIGDLDEDVSVVVEGALVPLTVNLLDPSGTLIASAEALVDGLTASGLDAPVTTSGTYTVQVMNTDGAFEAIEISIARTVRNP